MNTVLGLLFIAAGVAGTVAEYKHPPVHPVLLIAYGAVALLGALMIQPDPILAAFKRGSDAAGPYLPNFGRRANSGEIVVPPKEPDGETRPPT